MSKGRTLLSRPRTKVYESNYNIGQNYYKSALDGLDRKYGGGGSSEPATNGGLSALRASLERERERERDRPEPSSRHQVLRDLDDDEFFSSDFSKKKTNTAALLGEFDSIFETRIKNGGPKERSPARAVRAYDDDIDDEISASMKRLKAIKAARAAAEDLEEIESSITSKRSSNLRSKLDFSDKLIESVGLSSKARAALEEEGATGKRRVLKISATSSSEGSDADGLTRWTAVKSGSGSARRHILDEEEEIPPGQLSAAARAKKSRARLEDLEAEMQAISERGAAREKRVRDLKALVNENEANSKETLHSTVRVKSSIQSEKKTVTF